MKDTLRALAGLGRRVALGLLLALAAQAVVAPSSATAQTVLTPEQAARRLLDFAEQAYPAHFPSRQPTQALPPFLFRHYPSTGTYVGVVVSAGLGYEFLGVYVMGGPFGSAPVHAGPLSAFVAQPVAPLWLAGEAPLSGPPRDGQVQFFDFAKSRPVGDLVAVDASDPGRVQTLEKAGEWMPHARLFAADIDAPRRMSTGLRERWRTYFRNGRLYRLDLHPAPGALPTSSRLSTLSTLGACENGPRVFQNLPAPQNAWLVFRAPAAGVSNCYSTWSWRAVRAGMGPDDAPVTLDAEPVDAVRDPQGAIEGLLLQTDQRILLTDATLAVQRTLVDAGNTDAEVRAHGVHGQGAGRFLLYTQGSGFHPAEQELRAQRLSGGAPVTLFKGAGIQIQGTVIASDASGLYLMGQDGRALLHVGYDLSTRIVSAAVPPTDGRLFLTPTRVVMVAGNIRSTALISVPKAGGDPDVLATLSGRGLDLTLATIGEDVYVQDGIDTYYGGLHIVRSDGAAHQRLATGYIAAQLRPSEWPLDAAAGTYDHREGRAVQGGETTGAVLVVEGGYGGSMSGVDIVRFDPGRVRRVIGRLPKLANTLARPAGAPEPFSVRPEWDFGLGGRNIAAYQADGFGLLQRESGDLFLVDSGGWLRRATFKEPAQY